MGVRLRYAVSGWLPYMVNTVKGKYEESYD